MPLRMLELPLHVAYFVVFPSAASPRVYSSCLRDLERGCESVAAVLQGTREVPATTVAQVGPLLKQGRERLQAGEPQFLQLRLSPQATW